jgi:hypothetical protein
MPKCLWACVVSFYRVSYLCVSPGVDLKVLAELIEGEAELDIMKAEPAGKWETTGQYRHSALPFLKVSTQIFGN